MSLPNLLLSQVEELAGEKELRAGDIQQAVNTMQKCIDTIKADKRKIPLYRLLSQTYAEHPRILSLNTEGSSPFERAQDNMIALLKIDPEHEIDQAQARYPAELLQVYASIKTAPRFYLSGFASATWNLPQVKQTYSLEGEPASADTAYSAVLSWRFGLQVEVPLTVIHPNFRVGVGASLTKRVMEYEDKLFTYLNSDGRSASFADLRFQEDQQWFSFPLIFSYHHDKKWKKNAGKYNFASLKNKIVPYGFTGISFEYLQKAKIANIRRESISLSSIRQSNLLSVSDTPNQINDASMRNRTNLAMLAGIGLKIKTGIHYLYFEGRYHRLLSNIVNADNRYIHPELLYTYGYVDSDFRLDQFSFAIGFSWTGYRPSPRKHKK